jgi:AcrR family transcriptional regulator
MTPAARRAQLLDVAESTFAELGYDRTSFEDVAIRAGVTRPLLYDHFASKDELYLACVEAARGELETAVIDAVLAETEPLAQLRAGITAYFTFVQERGQRWDILFAGGTAVAGPAGEAAAEMRYRTAERLAALFARALPDADEAAVMAYAHGASGAAEQLAKWWRRSSQITVDELVTLYLEMVWDGLRRQAEPG